MNKLDECVIRSVVIEMVERKTKLAERMSNRSNAADFHTTGRRLMHSAGNP